MKYPMSHKIKIPKPWVSAAATDVGATIRAEEKRLAKLKELSEKFPTVVQIKRGINK